MYNFQKTHKDGKKKKERYCFPWQLQERRWHYVDMYKWNVTSNKSIESAQGLKLD